MPASDGVMGSTRTRLLQGFDDPTFGPEQWEGLLAGNSTDIVYLTWHFQRAWWEMHPRGHLLLIVAERDGQAVALAPFYAESGMIYFVGTGFETGYLDFIGDTGDPHILDAILETARDCAPDFLGFQFYFVPETSPTGKRLAEAADRLALGCYDEGDVAAPVLDLAGKPDIALAVTKKKDALAHERSLLREGRLEIHHLRDGQAILGHLEAFFEQHIARWAATPYPSRFLDPRVRGFIERLTRVATHTGWLRFIRLDWEGRPIAFQYGFCYRGRYVREITSFAIDLARRSPGQVLLRQSLLAAMDEKARTFDFGIGEQAYK